MKQVGGVFKIPCKVNGIPMIFFFDTGASDVTISITEAKFLLKQGLIVKEDFIGSSNYIVANGDIIEGAKIYLKTIDIDGIILKNVRATVINKNNAPLLLGQSAINKLGKYSIAGNKLIIMDSKPSENDNFEAQGNNINKAISFLNTFLNDESWIRQVTGSLTFNDYLKTISFKSKEVIKYETNTIIEIEYAVNLSNIESVVIVIHKADVSKAEDHNISYIILNLKNEIFYKNHTQEKGDIIPNYKNRKVKEVAIMFEKSLITDDLENIQNAIEDIFINIVVETKYL